MILTEDAATGKWCPFARSRPAGSYNCIASGCMAWRWDQAPVKDPEKWSIVPTATGYCGLAGAP